MVKVSIPFNEWSIGKLDCGTKFSTSRSKKYGEVGDYFEVFFKKPRRERIETNAIIAVVELPLWIILDHLWKLEGADSSYELRQVWKQIHPSFDYEKDKDKLYWVHFFKQISEGEKK